MESQPPPPRSLNAKNIRPHYKWWNLWLSLFISLMSTWGMWGQGGPLIERVLYSFWKDNKWWTFFRPWKDAYSCVVADPSLQLFVVNFIYPLNDPSLAWGCWQFRSRQLSPKHLKHLFIIKVKSFVKSFVF